MMKNLKEKLRKHSHLPLQQKTKNKERIHPNIWIWSWVVSKFPGKPSQYLMVISNFLWKCSNADSTWWIEFNSSLKTGIYLIGHFVVIEWTQTANVSERRKVNKENITIVVDYTCCDWIILYPVSDLEALKVWIILERERKVSDSFNF